ncbi:MAG: hypothetical protein LBM71_02940, partial [Elusimicrobiota bacterium]|nr:hypothetical protein [Elusimicrobiota bacterium]
MTKKSKIFLICFCLFTLICVYLFSKIKYEENILVMTPASISHEVKLFQSSPLSKKLFVVVEASSEEDLVAAVSVAQNSLKDIKGIKSLKNIDKDFLLSFYY